MEGDLKSGIFMYHTRIITEIVTFLKSMGKIKKLGIGAFGPIWLDKESTLFGTILASPKEKWRMFNLLKSIDDIWGPERPRISLDIDVNAIALFEFHHGGHKATKNLAYITVGTGVGVGIVVNGKTWAGLTHPEGGHLFNVKHPEEYTNFKSVWDFHDNCIEGFSSNVSIARRLNIDVEDLPSLNDDHLVWDLVAYYLAILCLDITLLVSPEVIVIGGGVMHREVLFLKIRKYFMKMLNGYITHEAINEENIHK